MKIIVLGSSGMIGSTMFKVLRERRDLTVWGTLRSVHDRAFFPQSDAGQLIDSVDVSNSDTLMKMFALIRPDVVVNCVGLTKHRSEAADLLRNLALNAVLPHRLADICELAGARLIHVSTDCVFLGSKGNYVESDIPDAQDFYGKTKSIGELISAPHAIILRTSTIGHELHTRHGLLEWFLSQEGKCKGFSRAIFSGLSTIAFARVVRDLVLPSPELHGLYNLSAEKINKYELLNLIARIYKKRIDITPDESLVIDRSLDSARFSAATGYTAPNWEEMINLMHEHKARE